MKNRKQEKFQNKQKGNGIRNFVCGGFLSHQPFFTVIAGFSAIGMKAPD
jgi:hypothetical protein